MFEEHNINDLVAEPTEPTPQVINWNRYIDPWSRTDYFERAKVVAVDFDETISDNPGTWLSVMRALELGGYTVYVVTWRSPTTAPEDLQFLVDKGYKIYYTSFKAKQEYMASLGIEVAIWIDDNPFAILNDAVTVYN